MTPARRFALALCCLTLGACASASIASRPRVVVTADPELDDSNSLVRYLLYSTDFETEGLIYASSQFHWKGDGTGKTFSRPNREYNRFGLNLCPCTSWRWAPNERFIDDAVETYAKVYDNLRVHDARYPTPANLKSKIRVGNIEFDGDIAKDTPGSDLIKALLLDDDATPIYLLAWGGQSTIARALKSIQDQFASTAQWDALRARISRKAILSTSGDQDDTYATYIKPNWPDIRILPAGRGGVPLAYGASNAASADSKIYYSVEWTRANVSSRGPLGAFYRVWGDGKQMVPGDRFDYFGLSGQTAEELRAKGYVVWLPPQPKGEFLGEGDTFTYLNLFDNGLTGYRDDTPGGWAGLGLTTRLTPSAPNFTAAAQNGLAARMLWSITPTRGAANHEPRVSIRGGGRISARAGETVTLQGIASDPDGNALAAKWWRWTDAGTYGGDVAPSNPTSLTTTVRVPNDATAGQTIQLVLEVTDNGSPPLTRYARAVITVK